MINRKKNLLVDGGRDCRASDSSFTSDAKHVMRGRERAMESARACVVFRE